MIRIFIEPTDVLIFRTGLPFDAGANSYAQGFFPPSPEPLQGALREYLARALAGGRSLEQTFTQEQALLGDRAQPGRFRMRGPFLARRTSNRIERLYPPPADLVGDRQGRVQLVQPRPSADDEDAVLTDWPQSDTPLWWLAGNGATRSFERWLTEDELVAWQIGDTARIAGVAPTDLWELEPRFGIKHQSGSKVVEDGFLYQLEFVRLKPGVGLDVDVWIDDDPPLDLATLLADGWGRLGGDGRTARYTVIKAATTIAAPQLMQRTRLYLATPTVFAAGWQSSNWAALVGSAQLVAAAVPHAVAIGGWSMELTHQGGTHKAMRRHVPAGSVYYFDQAISHRQHLGDDPIKPLIGYGVCYAGAW